MTPTLRPPKAPATRWPPVLVGVVAFALAVSAVLYQRDQTANRLTDLRAQLEHAEADQKTLTQKRKQANQAEAETRTKQQAVDKLEKRLVQLSRKNASTGLLRVNRRAALAAMMTGLSRSATENVVIQSIEHGSPQHEITGMASTPEAASRLARDLSGQLRDHWWVSPARIEPQTGPDRIVWRFSITIVPVALAEVGR